MAATVEIDETNGSSGSETVTHGITNSNFGSVDSPNLDPVANPIQPGNNSFEKWQQFHVTSMGGSSEIKNLKVWADSGASGSDTQAANVTTSSYTATTSYSTPTDSSSTVATNTLPTSEPGSANLGIGGSLSGALTSSGTSDYLVMQLQVDAATTSGTSFNINYQYDEVA